MVDGRAGTAVSAWLAARDPQWLGAVERVALDPHQGYRNALVGGLDAPEVVVDPFHIVRLANEAVDDTRRRTQRETTGHRGRRHDPLYGIRRLLLTAAERLTDKGYQRLDAGLEQGDPHRAVWHAWIVKEAVRDVYRAGSEPAARSALAELYATAATVDVPECRRLVRTLASWEDEILASYRSDGLSNAPTEAVNALAKKVKRVGHGFRNLHNYRLRLLLHCGGVTWHDQPAARLRKRTPQVAA